MPIPIPHLLYRLPYNCQNNNNCSVIIFYNNYFLTSSPSYFYQTHLIYKRGGDDVKEYTYRKDVVTWLKLSF